MTESSARLLGLSDRGVLRVGARADILVLPADRPLGSVRRSDLRIVMLGGGMRYGDREYATLLMPDERQVEILLAGRAKVVDRELGSVLGTLGSPETEIEVLDRVESAA